MEKEAVGMSERTLILILALGVNLAFGAAPDGCTESWRSPFPGIHAEVMPDDSPSPCPFRDAGIACTMTVTIEVDVPNPGVVCVGDLINVVANVTGGTPPFSYAWSNGETGPGFTVPAPYNQTLVLTVTDAEGCTAITSLHIKVDVLDFYIGYDMTPACAGDVVTLVIATTVTLPGLEYMWSTGETTSTIEVTTSGTYAATLSHPSLPCEAVHEVDIIIHPEPGPEPVIAGPAYLCSGQTATLEVINGPFGSYSWSTGDNTPAIEIVGPGYVEVTVTNAVGCTGTDFIEILEGSVPIEFNDPPPICEGQEAVLEVLNAGSFEEFLWSTGETTPVIIVLTPGTYTVTATAGACTVEGTITVEAAGTMIELSAVVTPVTSCVAPNGEIDLTVFPAGNYTVVWSGGQTTEDLVNIPAGTYSVTVTDLLGCTAVADFDVDEDTVLPTAMGAVTAASCGLPNGAIDLTVLPAGTYSFAWSNGMNSEDIAGITAGTYAVTFTDANSGCMGVDTFIVDNIDPPLSVTGNATPLTSCTMPNGAIDITVAPAGSYSFSWSGGQATEDLMNIGAGTYSVTVSAGGSCTAMASFTVDNDTAAPDLAFGITPATCGQSDGAVDLVTVPPGLYTFLWSTGQMTEDIVDVPAGTYQVTVTTPEGCTATGVAEVTGENFLPGLTAVMMPNTSCTGGNGVIDLTVDPPAAYGYLWSNGMMAEDLAGLPAGTYAVTVSLGAGCVVDSAFLVVEAADTVDFLAVVIPNGSCTTPNGAIDLTVNGPGPFAFSWSTGQQTEDIGQLNGGTYGVTITDASGCTGTGSFSVGDTALTFSVTGIVSPNTACGPANGDIDLQVTPPAMYGFLWSTGMMTEDLQDLVAGVYGVTVTDAGGCMLLAMFTVEDSLVVPQLDADVDTAVCGASTGSIDLAVVPAMGNSFLWSTGDTAEDISGLAPGIYLVTVTSSTGCVTVDTLLVPGTPPAFALDAVILPSKSCLVPDGGIDLSISPPGSYSIRWSTGEATEDLAGLSPGLYRVTVTDPAGCAVVDTFAVTSALVLPSLDGVVSPAVCTAGNGAVDITVLPPGSYAYEWSNGSASEDIGGLSPGVYDVVVTDQNGCTALDTFVVADTINVYALSGIVSADTSCIASTGEIDLLVTPPGPFSFLWSSGAITEDLDGLESGVYGVTITDTFGCIGEDAFIVIDGTVVPSIMGRVTPSACGQANGAIDLDVSPAGNYAFSWSSGSMTEDIQFLAAGNYGVTVTGSGDCAATGVFTVPSGGAMIGVTGTVTDNTACGIFNGAIDLAVSPAGAYGYAWSDGQVIEDPVALGPGTYAVTITDPLGCSETAVFMVADDPAFPAVQGVVTPSTCGMPDGGIALNVTPPSGNTFLWSSGQADEDLEALEPGVYSLTVTSSNGCTATAAYDVPGAAPYLLSLSAMEAPSGEDSVAISASLSGPWTILDTLIWLPESLFSCPHPLCTEQVIPWPEESTLIRVIAVDTNGCTSEAQVLLEAGIRPDVYIPNVFTPNGDGINDVFTVFGNEDVELVIELRIFDRWGNFVFRNFNFPPNLETLGWDGRFRGVDMNPAVFAFWARVRFIDGTEQAYKGDVTLLR